VLCAASGLSGRGRDFASSKLIVNQNLCHQQISFSAISCSVFVLEIQPVDRLKEKVQRYSSNLTVLHALACSKKFRRRDGLKSALTGTPEAFGFLTSSEC